MALDQIIKRNFWAPLLVLIAAAAFLNAQAVTQLIGVGLAADEKQLSLPPLTAKTPLAATALGGHATLADPILSRNPFDSVTGPLNKKVSDEQATAVADLSDPMNAPPCDGVKVLVIAASSDPDWSFAAFSAGEGKEPKGSILRRRGGEVGSKKVTFIGWDRVWLTGSGVLCQADLFKTTEPQKTVAAAPTPSAAPAPAGGAPGVPADIAKGIQKVSATEFNIDRAVVDKILENQADLMRQARIVPEQENGKMMGIRLFGVRPDTLLGTLGMENGDRLQTINGFDMTSPEKALEAYARLRTADHLTVQVNRRGSNMNLDYNIK
jgi:general secretion pathway protein C